MKIKSSLLLLLIIFFTACDSNYEEQQAEITRLKEELSKRNTIYLDLDKTMRETDESFSSIRTGQNEIDSLLQLPSALANKESILEKIEALQKYVRLSREKIDELDKQLIRAKTQGQETEGLRRIIIQLRKELDEKDNTILALNQQVENLETNLMVLRNEVNTRENTIKNQRNIIQETTQEKYEALRAKEQETLKRQSIELEKQISNLIKDGEKDELEGDKTKLAPNKKAQHYVDAYIKYKQARKLYVDNPRISSYMNYSKSEIENKMRQVKAKASRKAQEQMNELY